MRYHLAHSRDIKKNGWNNRCPSCGQRKFSPYIDFHTGKPIDEKHCGRCCRERSCAYHMRPSEWFKDNPPEKREWLPREQYVELMRQRRREAAEIRKQPTNSPSVYRGSTAEPGGSSKRSAEQNDTTRSACNAPVLTDTPSINRGGVGDYLSRMSTLCHKSRSDKNHLARWLCTQFPEEQVAEVLARYRTGSTRDGRIIYWQIDHRGQVRAGKVMAYNPDGHRRKGGSGNVCWVHSIKIDGIKFDEMLAPQCLFGEHLASPSNSPSMGRTQSSLCKKSATVTRSIEGGGQVGGSLCLVESEKTALIMSLVCPDRVWLATGGKANFKESMLWPLLGHEVAVYPDADALRDWEQRIHQLNRELGHRLYIPTGYYNLMDHDEARREGWDLADVVMG